MDEDEAVDSEDLSIYSEDERDINIRVEPSESLLTQVQSSGWFSLLCSLTEEQVPVLKGQYTTSGNQFTWIGIVCLIGCCEI